MLGYGRVRICSDWLCLIALPNDLQWVRLGAILPRKQVRSAVLRNALRRHLRESLRRELPHGAGYDLVLLTRGPAPLAPELSAAQNRRQLCAKLRKLAAEVVVTLKNGDSRPLSKRRRSRRLNQTNHVGKEAATSPGRRKHLSG